MATGATHYHLTESEVLRLLRASGNSHAGSRAEDHCPLVARDRALIGLLYYMALGQEALKLHPNDVNSESGHLTVRDRKSKAQARLKLAPELKPLLYEWENELARWDREEPASRASYLVTRSGKELRPEYVKKMLDENSHRAGIEKGVTPTTLRDSRAWHLLQSGLEPDQVKQLLRWRTEKTWPRYIKRLEHRSERGEGGRVRTIEELQTRVAELENALAATRAEVEVLTERISRPDTSQGSDCEGD